MILDKVASTRGSLTSLLIELNRESGIPLSTLKLNARILRELGLIAYGSINNPRIADLEPLGRFVMRLMRLTERATIRFAD